jgi:hypothetical protein
LLKRVGYEVNTWGGVIAPAGLPKAVTRLNEEFEGREIRLRDERYAALGVRS